MLEASEIVKRYGDAVVLAGVGFRLDGGELALLVGPNGAGKTTLLRILAGLLPPDGGTVRVGGYDAARHRLQATGQIGYVGHASLLYRDLSVEENLHLAAGLYGLAGPAVRRRGEALLAEAGLDARRHDRVRTLSQGQTKRLAIVRALIHEPPLLLLDEPFAALDDKGRAWLARRLTAPDGGTVLLATHQLDLSPEAVSRVLVLEAGKLREGASPSLGRPTGGR
jgi:heme ABC exporter ATP-binding subunit CcmA